MSRYWIFSLTMCLLIGCTSGKESPRGFSLPEGNAMSGKATFVKLECNVCHSTPDVEQRESDDSADYLSYKLGGEVGRVKTYADLVTSVINPSHRVSWAYPDGGEDADGNSRMRNYNGVMTVEQLVDLVTYLQPHYQLRTQAGSIYRNYYP